MTVEEVRSYTTWAISNYNEHKLDKKYLNQFTIIMYALFRLDKIYEVVKQFIILQLTDRIKTSQHHGQQIIGKFSDENEPATTNLINVTHSFAGHMDIVATIVARRWFSEAKKTA